MVCAFIGRAHGHSINDAVHLAPRVRVRAVRQQPADNPHLGQYLNYRRLASGAESLFHVEGCLKDDEYHLGRRWHLYTLAIYRDEWHQTLVRLLPDLAANPDRVKT